MRENKGKSLVALPTDYVVIDIETTGLDYKTCEIIEISAIRYSKGVPVSTYTSLVQPHPVICIDEAGQECKHYVNAFITMLTGITNKMLEDAPKLDSVIPDFLDFIGDSILLGHNVNFDVNFLYDATIRTCSRCLTNDFIDTLRIARKVFPDLEHHQLSDIAEACHIDQVHAHRAEVDCIVTAQCFNHMRASILETKSEEEFAQLFKKKSNRGRLSNITPTVTAEDIDDTNPVYRKVVVFTGALSAMTRAEAFQHVVNLGGIPQDSVTKKTNFLVIGDTDFVASVKDGKTSKIKKAEAYIERGLELSILSESTFFDLIEDYI